MPGPFGVFGRGDRLPGGEPFAANLLFKQTADYPDKSVADKLSYSSALSFKVK